MRSAAAYGIKYREQLHFHRRPVVHFSLNSERWAELNLLYEEQTSTLIFEGYRIV